MAFDSILGATLIGGVIAVMLYGALCVQCYIFFQRFERETMLLKSTVWALWILNTLHGAFLSHLMYWYMVTNYGNPLAIAFNLPWSLPGTSLSTCTAIVLIHCWYTYRVWILSDQNKLLLYPLVALVSLASGFGYASDIEITLHLKVASFKAWLFIASLSFSAAADLYIAVTLCIVLLRARREGLNQRTHSMINTLLVYIVNTGLLTSIVAVAAVVTSIVMPNNFIFVSIYFAISELYSNSMLTSLNARQRLRKHSVATSQHRDGQLTSVRFAPGEASATTGVESIPSSLTLGDNSVKVEAVSRP